MSERVSDERLTEMLAGLEGVTPGPWFVREYVGGCPFCGEKAFASTTLDGSHYVMCKSEDCWAMAGYLPTRDEAIAAWNRRAPTPTDADGLEVVDDLPAYEMSILMAWPEDRILVVPTNAGYPSRDAKSGPWVPLSDAQAALQSRDETIARLEVELGDWKGGHANSVRAHADVLARAKGAEARLASAMEVVRPFADLANSVFRVDEDGREMNAGKRDADVVWGFDSADLRYGHLRAAREFLEGGE